MSIINEVKELQAVRDELKQLRSKVKYLSKIQLKLENCIIKYLETHNQPGLKYNGKVIITQKKAKREVKKKIDKLKDAEQVLQYYGISESGKVLDDLLEAMRGTPYEKTLLKY